MPRAHDSTRWTRWLPACLALVLLLALVATAAELLELQVDARPQTLVLPKPTWKYASEPLPAHFETRAVRRADNTPRGNPITDDGATLGRALFYDTRLSADDSMSCATCHEQKRAFSDKRRVSRGIHGDRGRRNSMSLANARFHPRGSFFWDERAETLEAQVLMPIEDPTEMAFDLDALVDRLEQDPRYTLLFYRAFGSPGITTERIASALAQFVRAIVSYRSKFDEGMAQVSDVVEDFPNFTRLENQGKAIFFGAHDESTRTSCATCHTLGDRGPPGRGPNGDAAIALFVSRQTGNNGLDRETKERDDAGIGEITGDDADRGVFKIPTMRNIAVTAPYMHDGRFRTLKEVVDHYRKGVKAHPNLDRRLGGGRAGRGGRRGGGRAFDLTVKERAALIAFLRTLTDHALLEDPRFSDPWK